MQKRILYIGNKLQSRGNTITTMESLTAWFQEEGYLVYSVSEKKNKALRIFDMLYNTLKWMNKAEVVLIDTYSTQNFYYAVAVGKLCRILKLPYVPILHGGNLPERLKRSKSLCKSFFNGAKVNVAPSNYLMKAFKNEGYNNLVHIPNAIAIEEYPFLLRKEIKPKLLWVRSFAEVYNPLLALKILKTLVEKGLDATLCMVGPEKDSSLSRCKAVAAANNLPVTFTGKLEKKEWISLSQDYDLFINTTNFDNTPVSVIEAMTLGFPVVSTNVGGMSYLIDNEENGILVPPNSEEAFVAAIEYLLSQHLVAEKLSKNARSKAETFAWKQIKHRWFVLLNE